LRSNQDLSVTTGDGTQRSWQEGTARAEQPKPVSRQKVIGAGYPMPPMQQQYPPHLRHA
jgi:hypothetical protein